MKTLFLELGNIGDCTAHTIPMVVPGMRSKTFKTNFSPSPMVNKKLKIDAQYVVPIVELNVSS